MEDFHPSLRATRDLLHRLGCEKNVSVLSVGDRKTPTSNKSKNKTPAFFFLILHFCFIRRFIHVEVLSRTCVYYYNNVHFQRPHEEQTQSSTLTPSALALTYVVTIIIVTGISVQILMKNAVRSNFDLLYYSIFWPCRLRQDMTALYKLPVTLRFGFIS